ncbi:BOI-related E3 ubiquitin-protein ligase 1-like [Rhododendron vialii]|uniref:BOI-related E3 ubiquitin-protein ligase 1-like n=1 Tax=Rhododendron vialii TaxID=182163 RepID=UPI0026602318|nr:BOI-related E3 ubiquitin-protein ligase 1-like [Rhododendron vialii]
MVVQAQYPSTILLLNRGVQEGKNPLGNDYSLQPLPGGGFLDQTTTMIFTNGVGSIISNPRKRGRESSPVPFPHQFIDLTQLHTPPLNTVSTGLRLAFDEQQQQQLRRQQLQHHQSQQQTLTPQSSVLSEDLAAQIRQQRHEIDQLLHAQGDQLRRTLAEKRQRHYRALLGAAEESAARRLREKEAEVEKAARRNAELEARAAQLVSEAQAWQSRARAQEAAAAALQAQLQHAIIGGGGEGRADGGEELGEAEDAASAYVEPDRVAAASVPSCKACQKRVATVIMLPCRHLCLCTECGSMAQACPLCLAFRESSVEIFLS